VPLLLQDQELDRLFYSWMTGNVVSNETSKNLTALGPNVIPDRVGITYTFVDYYNSLTGDWKSSVGYQIGDFLIECSIGDRYCSQRDFTRFMHPLYGNCYTFNAASNGTEPFMVQQTGPLHGLTVTLFIDQTEYVGAVANSAGVSVVVHETNKQPFPEDSGISVSPGQETYIGLKQFFTQRLAAPYSDDCQNNYEEANQLNNMYAVQSNYSLPNVNYSQSACMKTCIQRQVEKRCNCSSPNLPISNPAIDPLYNSSYSICLYEYNSTLSTISDNAKCMTKVEQAAFKYCLANCKKDCE
uniref:Amiloride-sensitive sodium channel n=1 Tax=Macrostomum lignano TaxID=282301 RepID=A0A1I8FX90_9PLAT